MDEFESRSDEGKARPTAEKVSPTQDSHDQVTFHKAKNTSLVPIESTVQEKFGKPTISGLNEKGEILAYNFQDPKDQTHRNDTPPVPSKSLPGTTKESPVFSDGKPTAAEIEWFKNIATSDQIEAVKREINKFGQSPQSAILDAVKRSRIVLFGELHTTPDGMKAILGSMMSDLKAAGITHLAEEIRQKDQGLLDGIANGDEKAIQDFRKIYQVDDDWIAMTQAAAKEGIKIVAVDYNYADDADVSAPDIMRLRDNAMTNNMGSLVESDANARVGFLGGKRHLEKDDKDNYLSTSEQLAARGKAKGYTIATFASYAEDPPDFGVEDTGTVLAKAATHAIAIQTRDTAALKALPVDIKKEGQGIVGTDGLSGSMGKHDYILIVPVDTALKVTEEKYGKDSSQIIHTLKDLAQAYRHHSDNKVAQGPQLLDRALKLAEQHFGKDSTQAAECHRELGKYFVGARDIKSRQHLEAALSIFKDKAKGKFTPELSLSYRDLIDFHEENNPYQAMKYFNMASSELKDDIEKIKSEHWLGTGSILTKTLNKKGKMAAKVDLPLVAQDFLKNYAALLNQAGEEEEAKKIIERLK